MEWLIPKSDFWVRLGINLKLGWRQADVEVHTYVIFWGDVTAPPLRPIEIGKIINHDAQKLSKKKLKKSPLHSHSIELLNPKHRSHNWLKQFFYGILAIVWWYREDWGQSKGGPTTYEKTMLTIKTNFAYSRKNTEWQPSMQSSGSSSRIMVCWL